MRTPSLTYYTSAVRESRKGIRVRDPIECDLSSFRTSSFSGGSACVEVGRLDGYVVVRDSKDPLRRTTVAFTPDAWAALVLAIKTNSLTIDAERFQHVAPSNRGSVLDGRQTEDLA
jgi:hypothetical protein